MFIFFIADWRRRQLNAFAFCRMNLSSERPVRMKTAIAARRKNVGIERR
jgi:hypothetical protein